MNNHSNNNYPVGTSDFMNTMDKVRIKPLLLSAALILALSVSSCATKGPAYETAKDDNKIFTSLLREPKTSSTPEDVLIQGSEASTSNSGMQVIEAPSLSIEEAELAAQEVILPVLADAAVSRLAFNNMPVSAFINEVYGNQLNLNFVLEPSIQNAEDLVTMRIASPLNQRDMYALATQTLKSYGISASLRDGILFFAFTGETGNGQVPLLVSGRALPEVPSNSRPVFHIYPLRATTTPNVRSWLIQMFPRNEIDIKEDPARNALILNGSYRIIQQAIAAIDLLDRPVMQGMSSRIIRPALSTVKELADNLENILKSEGYAVKQGDSSAAIRLLPLESVGQLVIFARTEQVLDHIISWAETLETEKHSTVENGLFSYQVQSTQAVHIVQVLNSLGVANFAGSSATGSAGGAGERGPNDGFRSSNQRSNFSAVDNEDAKGRYAVDEQLNTILYSGSGKDWLQVLPVIKRLDKPAPSVMVEVILAEVTLNDQENVGIEWLRNTVSGDYNLSFGTLGGLGLGGSGFSLDLNNAGSTRAVLNAFYKNEKANIRSRPRIMVKSGGEASIDIGNEVPVITSNSQSTLNADAPIIQNISYRKTGVILDIKPTVHASGFVDIEISQELSEAADNSSSNIDSPIILNRKINTTVTLRDGGSVLLGGLISSTSSKGDQGVPILGKLPFVGNLFRTDSNTQNRTELMVMIIPYVLNSPDEAESLTDELQRARIDSLSADIVPQNPTN